MTNTFIETGVKQQLTVSVGQQAHTVDRYLSSVSKDVNVSDKVMYILYSMYGVMKRIEITLPWARISKRWESPGIDSQESIPVRQIGLSYQPARLHRLAESIPWNRFLGSWNVNKFGLRAHWDGLEPMTLHNLFQAQSYNQFWQDSAWVIAMDQITIKTSNQKCRLQTLPWYLIEFVDWRRSQSCWYFRPALWTVAPLHCVWISTRVCIHTVLKKRGEDRVVWKAYTGVILYVFGQIWT